MSRRSVTKWCSDFKSSQVGTNNNERTGRFTAAGTPENKTRVESAVLDNRRVTVSQPAYDLDLSHRTIAKLFRS